MDSVTFKKTHMREGCRRQELSKGGRRPSAPVSIESIRSLLGVRATCHNMRFLISECLLRDRTHEGM